MNRLRARAREEAGQYLDNELDGLLKLLKLLENKIADLLWHWDAEDILSAKRNTPRGLHLYRRSTPFTQAVFAEKELAKMSKE